MKSDLAKARDNWLQSEEGKNCCDGTAAGPYLETRIRTAFIAGWDAYEISQRESSEGKD
jgi:hypothetical protein